MQPVYTLKCLQERVCVGACAGPKRGFAADFVFRKMGGSWSPGLRLGLSSDARYAGWTVGFDRGFAAYLIFRKTAGGLWRE
jgi:hypothetical protein